MNKYSAQATRRTALATAATVAALALTSCSAAAPTASVEKKTVTIGIGNEAPFAFTESGSESLSGLDGEMLGAVAEAKGWKIKTFVTDFATLIPALTAKKADIIVDGMFITDKRKEQVNFTDPLYLQPEGMIVPAGSTLASKEDVKGKVIGAQTGTVYGEWVKTLGGSDVKFVDTQAALITAVENGQVDAAFTDSAVIGYSLVQKPNSKIKLVAPYEPHFQGIIGAGVRKEDTQLLADLNAGLVELKKTPKYLEILKKYGLGEENASK